MIADIATIRQYLCDCLLKQSVHPIYFAEGTSYNDLLRKEVITWLNNVVYRDYNVYTAWIICKEITMNLKCIIGSATADDILDCDNTIKKKMKKIIKQHYTDMFMTDPIDFAKCFCDDYNVYTINQQTTMNINKLTNMTIDFIIYTYKGDYPVIDSSCPYYLLQHSPRFTIYQM